MPKTFKYLLFSCLLFVILYLTLGLNFEKLSNVTFALKLRIPKLISIILVAYLIALSTSIFQAIIHNRLLTPSLLGMSSLYTLIHTLIVFFFGSLSIYANNRYVAFGIDLIMMVILTLVVYGYFFKKTGYNMLYILLIGTVLNSLFGSIQSSLIRIMDPNEYDALLSTLVASFSKVNVSLLLVSIILTILLLFIFKKDLLYLDVLSLGRDIAINLGVNYDLLTRKLLVLVALLLAIATALVGPLSFLGLIVVNIAREKCSTYKHSILIPFASILSICFLLGGQLIFERIFNYTVPISVWISLIGGIYFFYLLIRKEKYEN